MVIALIADWKKVTPFPGFFPYQAEGLAAPYIEKPLPGEIPRGVLSRGILAAEAHLAAGTH